VNRSRSAPAADRDRLLAALDRLLGRAMGSNLPLFGRWADAAPLPFASLGFAAYAVAAGAALFLAERLAMPGDPRFASLIVWGLFWYTSVLFLTRAATLRAVDTVRRDILPHAPAAFVAAVADDLEQRRSPLMQWWVPMLAALVAWVASGYALTFDSDIGAFDFDRVEPERAFWSLMALYLCFVAARGVLVGRFYEPFARRLAEAKNGFYVLGAADTPLVKGVASLGQQMVLFWAMIFLAILSIMVLAFAPLGDYGFGEGSKFLMFVVPTAGFASLGYGSLVYLRSEAAIRTALQRFAAAQIEVLQARCNALLNPAAGRLAGDPGEAEAVDRMQEWHDKILAGARYGNRLATVLSFTLPFVMPLLSVVRALLGWG